MPTPVASYSEGNSARQIPLEVLRGILKHSTKPTLASCIAVSRSMQELATPLLYVRVIVPFHHRDHPLIDNCYFGLTKLQAEVVPDGPRSRLHGPEPSPGFAPLARFLHTTHLTIETHNLGFCDTAYPILLPNLITLKILPQQGISRLQLCLNDDDDILETCPFLKYLRPRHLILGDQSTGWTGLAGIYRDSYSWPPRWIKSVVLYIGDDPCSGTHTDIDDLSPSLERFMVVLEPAGRAEGGKWRREAPDEDDDWEDPKALFTQLAKICDASCGTVEIVGLEEIDEDWGNEEMSVQEMQVRIVADLMRRGIDNEDGMEELARKVLAVKLLTLSV